MNAQAPILRNVKPPITGTFCMKSNELRRIMANNLTGNEYIFFDYISGQADGWKLPEETLEKETGIKRCNFTRVRKGLIAKGFIEYEPGQSYNIPYKKIEARYQIDSTLQNEVSTTLQNEVGNTPQIEGHNIEEQIKIYNGENSSSDDKASLGTSSADEGQVHNSEVSPITGKVSPYTEDSNSTTASCNQATTSKLRIVSTNRHNPYPTSPRNPSPLKKPFKTNYQKYKEIAEVEYSPIEAPVLSFPWLT